VRRQEPPAGVRSGCESLECSHASPFRPDRTAPRSCLPVMASGSCACATATTRSGRCASRRWNSSWRRRPGRPRRRVMLVSRGRRSTTAVPCDVPSMPLARPHARTQTHLRELQQGAAAGFPRGPHMQLRVHVLRGVRRWRPAQRLPELRRRFRPQAGPTVEELEERQLPREGCGKHEGETPAGGSRGACPLRGGDQAHSTRRTVADGYSPRIASSRRLMCSPNRELAISASCLGVAAVPAAGRSCPSG
jgi:hypothetical protein